MATTLALAACNDSTSPGDTASSDDYALVMYGSSGAALQGTLGPQGHRPFDGRSGAPQLPDSLKLTDEQKAEIEALRAAFQAAHQAELDILKAIFEEAHAAREAGATRQEVHDILDDGRATAQALRPAVEQLHQDIRAVFTAEQLAWLEAHRPAPPPDVDGRPRRDDRRPPGGRPPRGNG